MTTARDLLTPGLDRLRRHGRPVAWTPRWMGFGNQALAWFWAWRGRARGVERRVLRTSSMRPWLEEFPAAETLTVERARVRLTDQRLVPWRIPSDDGAPPFTQDWSAAELRCFVDEVLLGSLVHHERRHRVGVDADVLVVNVRRGDYYDTEHVRTWGFDIDGYLRLAVPEALRDAPAAGIHVVSDGPDWCRAELGWLGDHAPVTYADPPHGPRDHFATIASARRLVVTNSTFSYWAGYVGDVLHGDDHEVWAPRFFNSTQNEGRSWLLGPRWHVVESLPGGWQP